MIFVHCGKKHTFMPIIFHDTGGGNRKTGGMGFAGGDELESPQVVNSGWITVFPWMEAHLYWKGIWLVNNAMSWEKRTVSGAL